MKRIPLTRGLFATVDDDDYDWLVAMGSWHAIRSDRSGWYAARSIRHSANPSKQATQSMHRLLLGLGFSDEREGDHRDGNGLNNTRYNLRQATGSNNQHNKGVYRSNRSGLKGVYWRKRDGKWCGKIGVNGKQRELGYFDTKERAHLAYCEASARLHGEFGNTGLPAPYDKPATAVLMYRYRFTYPHAGSLAARAIGALFQA